MYLINTNSLVLIYHIPRPIECKRFPVCVLDLITSIFPGPINPALTYMSGFSLLSLAEFELLDSTV
jgi:hypothetical protein